MQLDFRVCEFGIKDATGRGEIDAIASTSWTRIANHEKINGTIAF